MGLGGEPLDAGRFRIAEDMDYLPKHKLPDQTPDWRARIKNEAYRKVVIAPLLQGCAARETARDSTRALMGGFWDFVDTFPAIIRETYTIAPAATANPRLRRFLKQATPHLAGSLDGMAGDERAHRALWVRSASRVGLSEEELYRWPVLPEVRALSDALRAEKRLARRLLYFVAVEIVAAGTSKYLSQAPAFVELMGNEGMQWFAAHLVHSRDVATHEAIAYELALEVKQAAHETSDEQSLNEDIQRCVDWFVTAGAACVREFVATDARP